MANQRATQSLLSSPLIFDSIPLLPRCPASIGPDCQGYEYHEDAYAPGQGLPDRRDVGLVEEQAAYGVDDQRDRLVFSEGAQPAGHALGGNERAAGEGQREEPDEAGGLCSLYAAHEQADGG